jgi:DNA (cytosine-5)-methyltransferase 1/site-specific DNA-methyltransferase (adenine-specific)
MEFKILDLFCGAGGFSYGFEQHQNFTTVLALDIDEYAGKTFKYNMPNASVVIGDITDNTLKRNMMQQAKELGVNMIIGGPPCQGYSTKGKKMGLADPRNFLFREYLSFVQELQPEVFIIENVKTLLSTAQGWFRDEILNTIKTLGYHAQYGIMNASHYGVPQTRERAIFICSKTHDIQLPSQTCDTPITVRDAIGDLAYLNSGEGEQQANYRMPATGEYQKMMRKHSQILWNHVASKHKQVAIDKLKMIPPEKGKECLPAHLLGKQKFKTTWGRLKWDEPSPTIDTRFDAASNGTNNHPCLHRAITPREAARIQSFDDAFVFCGSKVHIRKQIGNAVPPLMAHALAEHINTYYERKEETT